MVLVLLVLSLWSEGEVCARFLSSSFAAAAASAAFFLAVVSHSHLPPASGLPLVTSKSQRAAKAVVSWRESEVFLGKRKERREKVRK